MIKKHEGLGFYGSLGEVPKVRRVMRREGCWGESLLDDEIL